MNKTAFLVSATLVLTAVSPVAAETLPAPRPMEEMKGGCDAYAWDLAREFSLWAQTPQAAAASPGANGAPSVAPNTRLQIALHPHASVTFAVTPEKDRGGADKFSGLIAFTPPADGLYRISASSGLWIDAVQEGAAVESAGFEMQTGCETIFKSVAFPLKGGTPAIIQLNGSKTPDAGLLITQWPQ